MGLSDSDRPHVEIYTDGACLGNPGPGGWGAILRYGNHEKELSGGEPQTTNQRMELTAAIKGLEALKRPCKVTLYSDSAYLINAFQERWLTGGKRRDGAGAQKGRRKPRSLGAALGAFKDSPNHVDEGEGPRGPRVERALRPVGPCSGRSSKGAKHLSGIKRRPWTARSAPRGSSSRILLRDRSPERLRRGAT